jgi:hypothetical protein
MFHHCIQGRGEAGDILVFLARDSNSSQEKSESPWVCALCNITGAAFAVG